MQNGSTLVAHCGARKVALAELEAMPEPAALGPRHRPLRHDVLVQTIRAEAGRRGFGIAKEEYAIGHQGASLFGVLDFRCVFDAESGFALGFRSSQDQSLALRGVAGARVFVCDNLALAGSSFAFRRKHTSGLAIDEAVRAGFDRYEQETTKLAGHIARLRETPVTDTRAKELIYDAVAGDVVPARLLRPVHSYYFDPADDRPDCAPRTLWGLHNSFTRAVQVLPPTRAWSASSDLGRLFGMAGGLAN